MPAGRPAIGTEIKVTVTPETLRELHRLRGDRPLSEIARLMIESGLNLRRANAEGKRRREKRERGE